jgi:hypothetical protein
MEIETLWVLLQKHQREGFFQIWPQLFIEKYKGVEAKVISLLAFLFMHKSAKILFSS